MRDLTFHNGELAITLGLRPIGFRRFRVKALAAGKVEEPRVPRDRPAPGVVHHHGAPVVRQDLGRDPAKICEGVLEAAQQRILAGVADELQVETPGVAQGGPESRI